MDALPFQPLVRQSNCSIGQLTPETGTLLAYLSSRFNYLDAEEWREQLLAGNLLRNGHPATADELLCPGDQLQFQPRFLPEPAVSWDIVILHEDQDSLVVVKPGNLPCHPAGRFFNHTLWAWLKQFLHLPEVHFCQRLDRETSGLVIVAKTAAAAAQISRALHSCGAVKEYLVIVHGAFPDEEYCRGWLYPDRDSAVRKKRVFSSREPCEVPGHCESASTYFRRLAGGASSSLLLARLETGRTHQIRATLHSLGYPVAGDKLYGLDEQFFLRQAQGQLTGADYARLRFPRQALHATRIVFARPGREPEEYHSPLPADLQLF
ncbi:MAG: RluA family pseudouridine synthase [Oligosphaeraceae bacterium]|nr:RluA family pseudouridine synthase [Oligosphaeraceae bacterium]